MLFMSELIAAKLYKSITDRLPHSFIVHAPTIQDRRREMPRRKHKVSHVHKTVPRVAPTNLTLSLSATENLHKISRSINLQQLTVLMMT
jgi:hypothetical protein